MRVRKRARTDFQKERSGPERRKRVRENERKIDMEREREGGEEEFRERESMDRLIFSERGRERRIRVKE